MCLDLNISWNKMFYFIKTWIMLKLPNAMRHRIVSIQAYMLHLPSVMC